MKSPSKLAVIVFLLGAAGLTLFIILLMHQGVGEILHAVSQAGWALVLVIASHFLTLYCDSMSWRALLPRQYRPRMAVLLYIHWIGDSISSLLPAAQVGGEIVRVRMLGRRDLGGGVPLQAATSSVLVGMTVSLATQIVFGLSGLALMIFLTGRQNLVGPILLMSLLGVACCAAFYAVQRLGIFRIGSKIILHVAREGAWQDLVQRGEKLDEDVRALYGNRRAIWECVFWTMCTWFSGAVEVWMALWALGVHTGYAHAYVLESMAQGIRSAAFLVPAALGVQEGGYLLVGRILGIGGDSAMALALMRRARELVFGIPGLLAWQWSEGHRLWKRSSAGASDAVAGPARAP